MSLTESIWNLICVKKGLNIFSTKENREKHFIGLRNQGQVVDVVVSRWRKCHELLLCLFLMSFNVYVLLIRKGERKYFSSSKKSCRELLDCVNPSTQSTLVALREKWPRVPMVRLGTTLCAAGGPGAGCGSSPFRFRRAATQYFLLNCFVYGIEESLFCPEAARFRWCHSSDRSSLL